MFAECECLIYTRLGGCEIAQFFVRYYDDTTMRCFFCGLVRLYRGKIFARWLYKIQTYAMTRRCVAFFVDWCVCIGVKYLQDGFTKIQTHAVTRRCVALFVDWCVCIGVKYLQDGFTKIQTHAVTRRCVALFVDWIVCIGVKYLQDGFTKIQTHAMTRPEHGIPDFISFMRTRNPVF